MCVSGHVCVMGKFKSDITVEAMKQVTMKQGIASALFVLTSGCCCSQC